MTVFELLLEGDMQVEIDGDRLCIQPGEIVIIPPGKTVLRGVRGTCRKVVFGICGLLHQSLLSQLSLIPYSVLRVKEPERVLALLQELYRLLEQKDTGSVPRMSGLTVELLMEVSREVAGSPEPLLADVLRFLECNLAENVTLSALAARFHVSADSLNRLFLVFCFGMGAATAVMVGKSIGEGKSQDEVMSLSQALLRFTVVFSVALAAIALALLWILFKPVVFPMFKLFGQSADIAMVMGITAFASLPLHAYTISAITGVLRAGGDVFWSAVFDLAPQWVICLPLTSLCALVLQTDIWPIALAMQTESFVKIPLCAYRIHSRKWISDVTASLRRKEL